MAITFTFIVRYYPYGNADLLIDGSPITNAYPVAILSKTVDGVETVIPLAYISDSDNTGLYQWQGYYDGCQFLFDFWDSAYSTSSLFGRTMFNFVPDALDKVCSFQMEESFLIGFLGLVHVSDNGGGTTDGFTVPDLDGNFGALPNGSIVTVSGRLGEYIIEASQQLWAFPASEFQGSCVIYKLSKDGKILLVPHFLITLKTQVSV